jgi:hypothetical protein
LDAGFGQQQAQIGKYRQWIVRAARSPGPLTVLWQPQKVVTSRRIERGRTDEINWESTERSIIHLSVHHMGGESGEKPEFRRV